MDCYRATNNKYTSCPALMSDGRGFTDYRSSRQVNDSLRNDMDIISSHNFREFLIRNSDKFIETDRKNAHLMNGSSKCVTPYDHGTMLSEKFLQTCDKKGCSLVLNNKGGLGVGSYSTDIGKCNLHFKNSESSCTK